MKILVSCLTEGGTDKLAWSHISVESRSRQSAVAKSGSPPLDQWTSTVTMHCYNQIIVSDQDTDHHGITGEFLGGRHIILTTFLLHTQSTTKRQ